MSVLQSSVSPMIMILAGLESCEMLDFLEVMRTTEWVSMDPEVDANFDKTSAHTFIARGIRDKEKSVKL